MRAGPRWVGVALLLLAAAATPVPRDHAANLEATADRVFGQPEFTSDTAKQGGLSAASLSLPRGLALDAQRNL